MKDIDNHYYNKSINSLFILLDQDFFTKWEDRNKDIYLSSQFYCIYDILNEDNYIISCDEFEDSFILVDDANIEEFSNNMLDYSISELDLARIKKLKKEAENRE